MILRKVAGTLRRPFSSILAGLCPIKTFSSTMCRAFSTLSLLIRSLLYHSGPLESTTIHHLRKNKARPYRPRLPGLVLCDQCDSDAVTRCTCQRPPHGESPHS